MSLAELLIASSSGLDNVPSVLGGVAELAARNAG
jgi:hypothetical protein